MSGNISSLNAFRFRVCNDAICGLKVATICSISTLTTLGNLITLIVIGSTASLRNCHGLLIMSLSLADFSTGLVASLSIYPSVCSFWPFGDITCQIAATTEAVVKKTSLLTLTLLSIERYIAVVHPLKYSRIITKQRIAAGLALCWFGPIAFFIALILTGQSSGQYVFLFHSCTITYQSQILSIALNVGLFILPSVVILSVTTVLAWLGMKKVARVRAHMIAKLTPQAGQTHQAVKFFRMIRIMAFAFYACWAPHVVIGFACLLADVRQPWGVFFATYWLHFSNSFWNVIIYSAMNKAFRRRAVSLFISPMRVRLCNSGDGSGNSLSATSRQPKITSVSAPSEGSS
ncbi:histamine H2 receptor-like [Acanthaster planci]|uniref:Histamine H2 receptor-like n=1 Tax=Acanthaster planci TaxID=133434 RepID=A0A8B7ZPN1_ACAPL|nr:histamine H2 receptor-like [Acanthaster planci]